MANITREERQRRQAARDAEGAPAQQPAAVNPSSGARLVRMMRDPASYPAPHSADVPAGEVEAWRQHDWREAD